ncbi:MAG: nuclear transport factor 2 family protein, partial [Halioglobus sp.]|nr:nuclear transport factor 2 family protein [Halioglobus sp.]
EAGSERRWHVSTGVLVRVEGDSAKSECYGLSMGTLLDESGEKVTTLFGGRYLDELQKRDGQWRISKRTYIADWAHQFPDGLEEVMAGGLALNVLRIAAPGHEAYRPL